MYRYYRVTSNNGYGDVYYTFAKSAAKARENCGFEFPDGGEKVLAERCSRREAQRRGYGIHMRY